MSQEEEVGAEEAPPAEIPEDQEPLKKALAEEKEKAEKYLSNWQRAQADYINYKRRAEQDRNEVTTLANALLVASLLPVLDDFERAFASLGDKLAGLSWVDGIDLIHRKLLGILEAQGLAEIKAVGEEFDPRYHEAIMYADGEEGKVLEELQKGYKFRDRVIRPSLVKVGGKVAETKAEGES